MENQQIEDLRNAPNVAQGIFIAMRIVVRSRVRIVVSSSRTTPSTKVLSGGSSRPNREISVLGLEPR